MKITAVDLFIIIIIPILLSIALFFQLTPHKKSMIEKYALIITETGEQKISLNNDTELIITGKLGDSIIKIENQKIFFIKSPCQNQVCVKMPKLAYFNSSSACLPNGVIVKIIGNQSLIKNNGEIDAITK